MIINSKQNSIIKYAHSLKETKNVLKSGECLVESEKLVKDLLKSRHLLSVILCEINHMQKYDYIIKEANCKVYYISAEISKYLTDSVTPSGIFAFVKVPSLKYENAVKSNFLVLENIQDPTNFGALIRSARAFNFNTIILIGNGVFPYSFKAIRSSMGYVFDVNILNLTLDELKQLNLPLFVADMQGEDLKNLAISKQTLPFGVAIGNEGKGVSNELKLLASKIVKIPMLNNVESLNASVSGGILMYNLSNKIGE